MDWMADQVSNQMNLTRKNINAMERGVVHCFRQTMGWGHRKAVAYIAPDHAIKVTRMHKPNKRERGQSAVLTSGKPNFAERKFIKLCQKSGQKFPIRDVQVTPYK